MSLRYYLKVKAYRAFNTDFGKFILNLFSRFVYAINLTKSKSKSRFPFIIAITIDTESGYVEKNDYRVWQKSEPKAYIGFYKGIEAWRKLLSKYQAKATFFLSTNCFSAKGSEYKKIIEQLKLLLREKHEIGLHLHPDSDLALQKLFGKKFSATSAKFFSYGEINKIVSSGKYLIKKNLGIDAISARWGNWGLSNDAVKALQKNGFIIDSSATPQIKGHLNDTMFYDWSNVNEHYPWKLSTKDYQNTSQQDSAVLEIPIATFRFFGINLRADPANSALLLSCFDYYYKNVDRSEKPFVFVVISHSTEAIHKDGTSTKVIKVMEEFLKELKKYSDVRFLTLKESYRYL